MGKGKAKPVDTYRGQMETAATAASQPNEFQKEYNAYNKQLWDMYTGKTAFDLSKMPNASATMALYEGAKKQSDRGRIGRGLVYGGGAGSEGYNPNLIAAIDAQNQDERERDAAGAIEQRVADQFNGLGARMAGIGESEANRLDRNWQRYAQMYQVERSAPQKKKWWESLLGGAAQAGVSMAMAAI